MRKNISNLSSAELAKRVVKVNVCHSHVHYKSMKFHECEHISFVKHYEHNSLDVVIHVYFLHLLSR